MKNTEKPPKNLTLEGQKLYAKIAEEIELDEAARLMLVVLCEADDRRRQARDLIAKEGPIQTDRFGQKKPHPAIAIERDCATTIGRCFRLLGCDLAATAKEID